jgi:hypothetical protein
MHVYVYVYGKTCAMRGYYDMNIVFIPFDKLTSRLMIIQDAREM